MYFLSHQPYGAAGMEFLFLKKDTLLAGVTVGISDFFGLELRFSEISVSLHMNRQKRSLLCWLG